MGQFCRGAAKEVIVYQRSVEEYTQMGGPAWKYADGEVVPVTKIKHSAGNRVPHFELADKTSIIEVG